MSSCFACTKPTEEKCADWCCDVACVRFRCSACEEEDLRCAACHNVAVKKRECDACSRTLCKGCGTKTNDDMFICDPCGGKDFKLCKCGKPRTRYCEVPDCLTPCLCDDCGVTSKHGRLHCGCEGADSESDE